MSIRQTRREARRLRRKLNHAQRAYVDSLTSGIWTEVANVDEAESLTRAKIEHDADEMGFDPATILLLVQLAVAIYQALKHLNVLAPSSDLVGALFEGAEDD